MTAAGNVQDGIAVGDFTGDGHIDLAVANSGSNTMSVLLGNGDGTFQSQVTYPVGQAPQAVAAGDFTGDGHLDLAVTNSGDNTVSVLLGNGDGTFRPQVTYPVGQAPQALVAGDFTGDGHLDLAVANSGSNTVSMLLGRGDGTFAPRIRTTWERSLRESRRATSMAMGGSTSPSPGATFRLAPAQSQCC